LDKVIVIKLGGATLGKHDTTLADLAYLQQQGKSLVVIHGGAKISTQWLKRLGISTRFIDGERVTCRETLDVVTAVLAGLVNKEIVAALNNMGGRAMGISGVDGCLIQGKRKSEETGYMGVVESVDAAPLEALLGAGYIPVISPISARLARKTSRIPQLLNINGDPVAGEIAAAIGAERLIFLTDVDGVRDESGKLLSRLSPEEAEELLASGVVSGGMVPKIRACIRALAATSVARIIDGNKPHALLKEIMEGSGGTTIEK